MIFILLDLRGGWWVNFGLMGEKWWDCFNKGVEINIKRSKGCAVGSTENVSIKSTAKFENALCCAEGYLWKKNVH